MKRVHFVTLSRSDYASTKPVIMAAQNDPDIDVKVIAGGAHLLERYGDTINDVRADCDDVVIAKFLREDDNSDADMAAAYARACTEIARILTEDTPDILFILGDRWEMQAAAGVASMLRIPIAHHSGGDITQGSADNQTRYVLSALSHLHFTALEEHARRLIAMGEEPWRVTATGEPALMGLKNFSSEIDDIHHVLGIKPASAFVLATFHPTSYDPLPPERQIDEFLKALDLISDQIILTAPNPDPGSASFADKISAYAATRDHVHLFESLGAARYYAAMEKAEFMIGNSSSGLWEAPSFGLPVINIGPRQDGRVRGANVVDVPLEPEAVRTAIGKISAPNFIAGAKEAQNPYVREDTLALILDKLKSAPNRKALLAKKLIDPLGQ